MPAITLPDGSQRVFENPVSVADVAADIGAGLAKATLAGVVDGEVVDASHVMESDATLSIITDRSDEALDIIRHSSAHLLAMAVKQLFPSAQVTIGPVIEDGFYYDFSFERTFTPEDLEAIEQRMSELSKEDFPVTREVWDRDEAVEFFKSIGEEYKAEIIASIPAGEPIGLYRQGDFIDLCRGPHVPSTGKLSAFKLTKVAGAYWRGDSNNEMLQRIYGTAWTNKKELKAYINRLAEAESATTAKLPRSWISSICRRRRRVQFSGTRRAGVSTKPSKTLCAASKKSRATRKLKPPRWWTLVSGKSQGTRISSVMICLLSPPRIAITPSSR